MKLQINQIEQAHNRRNQREITCRLLVRSTRPFSRLPKRSPSCRLSHSWYAGVFFLGIQVLPSEGFPDRAVERSTTLAEDAYLNTSRYNNFDSTARERRDTGVGGLSKSESDPSLSDNVDDTSGGVGSRKMGPGRDGSASTSRMRSWPLRKEFSVRRKRTVPRKASSCNKR